MHIQKRISDIIQIEDIQTWTKDCPVIISAGTGSGKSYFVKNILYQYAKERNQKILMLIHRKACVDQFQMELEKDKKTDVITVKTYQKIEYTELQFSQSYLEKYTYIVNDEFHYFISDAGFNNTTDISLQAIMETDAIKIFMSATGSHVRDYLKLITLEPPVEYTLQPDYSAIENLYFCFKESDFEEFAKELLSKNEKAIFFVQRAERAYNLYRSLKDYAVFNCSKNNNRYYQYVDGQKIEKILREQKFVENFLITTCCMDAGVNIIDLDLKYIFVDVDDIGSLIQCVGRKRIQNDNDKILCLCIRGKTNNHLGGDKSNIMKQLEMADYLREHTVEEYAEKYYRQYDISQIIYDMPLPNQPDVCTKRINKLMYLKKQKDIEQIDKMLHFGKNGFCKYLARYFGKYDKRTRYYDYIITEGDYKIEQYLKEHVGITMYTAADKKELIEMLNIRRDGHLLKTDKSINSALKEDNIPYKIKQFKIIKNVNGERKTYKSAWKLIRYTWRRPRKRQEENE